MIPFPFYIELSHFLDQFLLPVRKKKEKKSKIMNPFAIIVAVKQSSEQSSPGNLKAKESFF